jgi:hypothetical protein
VLSREEGDVVPGWKEALFESWVGEAMATNRMGGAGRRQGSG